MSNAAPQIAFEVSYELLRSVDAHPIGGRIRAIMAANWMDASDKARRVYGEDKVDAIQVNSVTTRTETRERFYHYDRHCGRTGKTER